MSPKISICIPAINGNHIIESLDSIFNSKFGDFEIIVNDSSQDFFVSDMVSEYDVKLIKRKTKPLESRYITVSEAKGENILLLDETRIMSKSLLGMLDNLEEDMVVIGEREIGKGLITFISNLDKKAIPAEASKLNPTDKSIIPRYYRRKIITDALKKVKSNLPSKLFQEVVGLDLELIYLESYNLSHRMGLISTPEIMHYGEKSIREVVKKYYRYAYTEKMLRNSCYNRYAGLSGRMRSSGTLKDRIRSLPVMMLRGPPFVLGYISSKRE
jgi:glycosyltransferase involved in cell wall biosynthesis